MEIPRRRTRPALPVAHQSAMGFRVWRVPSRIGMPYAHTHPDIELNWLRSGRIEYVLAGRRVTLVAGQLGIFWGGVPHQLIVCDNIGSSIWTTLPLAWFLRCEFSNGFAAWLMTGQMLIAPLAADRAEQWLKDFDAGPSQQRLVLLELEALFERLALATPKPLRRPSHASANGSSHMERLTAYLASHYQEPLSIDEIAAALDLHPKYLMTLFRKSVGLTIKTYVMRLRLAHAQRLLATTRMAVIDVAMDSGFGSLARFYDAFARHVGQRPLQYRRQNEQDAGSG